jgi:superfamily II RNA helicase
VPVDHPLLARLPPLGEKLADRAVVFDRFLDYVGARGIELYPAQEEALLEICADKNVILGTPTGSGKSLVAEAMHFLAMSLDKRSVYTSPIKALVNEKFFALCELFHPDNVGLMTGDATVNRDAPIVCCTAEILANWALREGEATNVAYAILDEFHYYADRERGVAWQVPLLTMPRTTFMLMSATLGDPTFFAEALTKLNGRPTATVLSKLRPVPLDYSYVETPLHETIPWLLEQGRAPIYVVSFTQKSCHETAQSLMSVNVCSKEDKAAIGRELEGHRFDTPYGRALSRFLRHGIGVHHGGMLPKHRRVVERLAQKGLLRVISGTDTLGVGINIPIRTVLLTQLCKFDGAGTRILSAREFHQLCGRAGRKGFDDQGSVVAQAPEHVIENLRLEAKAVKGKKIVRKKPPEKGYVHFTRATFDELVHKDPEPLESQFQVSHAMLLAVLGRERGGCRAMKRLVRDSHERPAVQRRIGKTALQMLRSLVEADIVSFEDNPAPPPRRRLAINVDLQQDFSLYHALSLFVVEALEVLPRDIESYPLDVLAVVEAILEDPRPILQKQLDRAKTEAIAQWKAEGLEYDERMAKLEEIEYPKPNKQLLYGMFDAFRGHHPWVGEENVRPKGAARDLYERCLDFHSFVIDYGLERYEGMVLRYLTDVYKALVQNVPEKAATAELDEMIDFFESVVRGVDASLLEEWERLRDPTYQPAPAVAAPELEREKPLIADRRAFTVLLRNALFGVVRALALRDYAAAAARVEAPAGEAPWTADRLAEAMAPYYEDHQEILTGPRARGTRTVTIDESQHATWSVRQTLCDPAEHDDWFLEARVDLQRSNDEGRPILVLQRIGG